MDVVILVFVSVCLAYTMIVKLINIYYIEFYLKNINGPIALFKKEENNKLFSVKYSKGFHSM